MMPDTTPYALLGKIFGSIFIAVIIFIIARIFVLWYFQIDVAIKLLKEIRDSLKK